MIIPSGPLPSSDGEPSLRDVSVGDYVAVKVCLLHTHA